MSEEVYDSFGIRDTFTSMGSIASSSRSGLRQQMVRVNALRPGDILLSLGSGLFSRLIAKLSDGEFSHASLCASPFMIFESDGETLIGYKAFQSIGLAETRFGTGHLAEIPGEPKRCVVYRHPEMSGVAPDRFRKALEDAMTEFYGKHYSQMERLVRLADLPEWMKNRLTTFYRSQERLENTWRRIRYPWHERKIFFAAFCSELVTAFYNSLGLPLFPTPKEPGDVSPNDLARSAYISPVDGTIVTPGDLTSDVTFSTKPDPITERYEKEDPVALQMRFVLVKRDILNEFKRWNASQAVDYEMMRRQLWEQFVQLMPAAVSHLELAMSAKVFGALRRAVGLNNIWLSLNEDIKHMLTSLEPVPEEIAASTLKFLK